MTRGGTKILDKFVRYNRIKTKANVKDFFLELPTWQLEVRRSQSHLHSASFSDTKVSTSTKNVNEERLVTNLNAQRECALRTETLKQLASINQRYAYYADLLRYRWINGWSIKKACEALADKYDIDYIAERTFTTHQELAACAFAAICPRDLRVLKGT